MTGSLEHHEVVSRNEWLEARKMLLKKEKEFTILRDQLSQERRKLPWIAVDKEYIFEGPKGKETLSELFDGRSQLIVYHFMFHPSWDGGCSSCSFWADNFNGIIVHLNERDVTMVAISRATYNKLAAYEKRLDWNFKWVSSYNTDSISITTYHLDQKRWPRRKPSITSLHKILTVQSGRESAFFTKTMQVACFTPTQLTHVV
ncbi:MAG TPA: DUF899 family protein [Nitrososphaeraceae archaeon]|nr:DUF899 family protein [Nitrososphaeraceae archaeon]